MLICISYKKWSKQDIKQWLPFTLVSPFPLNFINYLFTSRNLVTTKQQADRAQLATSSSVSLVEQPLDNFKHVCDLPESLYYYLYLLGKYLKN